MYVLSGCVVICQAELKLLDIDNVGLHNLSPGMVTTDLLMSGPPSRRPYSPKLSYTENPNAQLLLPKINSIASGVAWACRFKCSCGRHPSLRPKLAKALIGAGADTKVSKFFINCLAEEPEDVVRFLVPRMRKVRPWS